MEIADKELIAEFVIESQEGLAHVERQMLAIEAAGAQVDIDQVNAVFRTMHSIKGAAGFLGLEQIGNLAHRLEELLNHMRNRDVIATSEMVTTMLSAADCIKDLLDSVDTSNEADISGHLQQLGNFLPTDNSGTQEPLAPACEPTTCVPPIAATTPDVESILLTDAVREFLIECYENLEQMDRDLLALEQDPNSTQLLRGIFRTMHTIKGGAGFLGLGGLEQLAHAAENLLGKLRDNTLTLTAEITSALLEAVDVCNCGLHAVENPAESAAFQPAAVIDRLNGVLLGKLTSTVTPASAPPNAPAQRPAGISPAVALKPATPVAELSPGKAEPAPAPAQIAAPDAAGDKLQDTTIRVDVALLDKLMTRVGELVLARNQILQRTSGLEDAEFVRTAQRLNLITTELQEGVMKTRMQPIGNVWAKFPRVVRDLSAQLGKQIRIEMDGKDTELDKTIVEAIKDPLTHLVRNSIDHGIETPAARRAAGKSEEGCLTLRAYHEGGQVNIEITDDGAGLNLDRIRKKALERGLITADQAGRLSEREAAQLILLPGFSTAEQVTSVSGRGVGMDVVKTNIEKIGGTLDLQTRPGQGTTIKIKIPLTLAIIPALIVTCDGDRYAIPQVSLLELVRLEGEQATRGIENVHDTPVYRLRGKLLPLVYLSEHLRLRRHSAPNTVEENSAINIVVLRADDRQFGLVVDKVNDTEEIVVKPLGKQLKSVAEYAGATIMGDGDVALILDVKGLAVASGLGHEIRDRSVTTEGKASIESAGRKETLLIVDVGDARGFALLTSMVARLEKISRTSVELANGREVIQYRGAILPLVRLADVVGGAPPAAADAEMQVIVYDELGQRFGLIVERIVDITEAELNFAIDQDAEHYLLGTTVVQQRVKDVLNLRNLARFDRAAGLLCN